MARPSKYESHVKSRFKDIIKWLELGATEKEIAQNLGIAESTFMDYKNKYLELSEFLRNNRKQPVEEIKAAMFKRARGFQYEEKKVTTQRIRSDDGSETPETLIKTEITTKMALPDVAAGLVLLQHWDRNSDGTAKWSRDPKGIEIKEKELELKKEAMENENW